jgi:hypothetical protein
MMMMMMMSVEQSMKFLVGETDVPGENLPGSSLFTANPT